MTTAITWTWKITNLLTLPTLEGQSNVVVNVEWNFIGANDVNTAIIAGKTPVKYVKDNPFIDFEYLTEAQVINWVKEILSDAGINSLKQALQSQIDSIENVSNAESAQPLPWAIIRS
jgi:hypothetical protein